MAMKILVPVDGSPAAGRAAAFAAKLAQAFEADLTLVHVFDAPATTTIGLVAHGKDHLEEARRDIAKNAFENAAAQLGGTPFQRIEELGEPAKRIVAVAEEGHFDHIVIGRRGLSQVEALLLGTVSERVLHHAPCPVTVVH